MKPNLVALVVDQEMFPAAAFVATRLASLNPRGDDVDIAILSDSTDDLEKARTFGVPARLIQATLPREMERAPVKRISVISYLRLFITEFVDPSVRRVLYVDADVYPEDDRLFGLFDLDMRDTPVAAVRDIRFLLRSPEDRLFRDLARSRVSTTDYLNGGALLIDTNRFSVEQVGWRAFNFGLKERVRVDIALNRALGGKWQRLSPVMNCPMDFRGVLSSVGYRAALTHFIGEVKPWFGPQFAAQHPARAAIESYLSKSPWRSFLAKHNDFQAVWDTLQRDQGGATFAAPPKRTRFTLSKDVDLAAFNDYLRTTDFADVQQGLTIIETPD